MEGREGHQRANSSYYSTAQDPDVDYTSGCVMGEASCLYRNGSMPSPHQRVKGGGGSHYSVHGLNGLKLETAETPLAHGSCGQRKAGHTKLSCHREEISAALYMWAAKEVLL